VLEGAKNNNIGQRRLTTGLISVDILSSKKIT